MFRTLLLAAALVISAPVQAESMTSNDYLNIANSDITTREAQMQNNDQQMFLEVLDLDIARR